MSNMCSDTIKRGTEVEVDLSIRYEDVDEVVEAEVYKVDEDETRPYYISDSRGRLAQVSTDSIIKVVG